MIAGVDFTFSERNKRLVCVLFIAKSGSAVKRIHSLLSSAVRRGRLHFREMSKQEKIRALSVVDRLMSSPRDFSVIFIEIEARRLCWKKRVKLEAFLSLVLRNSGVKEAYFATDIDGKRYVLAERIRARVKGLEAYRSDDADVVQLADVFGGWYRRRGAKPSKVIDC